MHFGLIKKNRSYLLVILLSILFYSCKDEGSKYTSFLSPEAGTSINSGNSIIAKLDISSSIHIDSIVYFIDTTKVGTKADTSSIEIATTGITLGNHVLLANVYSSGQKEEVTTNIILLAASAPVEYSFKIKNTFPHDATSYVQGLEFHKGFLYESSGQYGNSSLRKVELNTGKVVKKVDVSDTYFAEGLTVVNDKIIQITYRESTGFVYDFNSFNKLSEFSYPSNREGWGLCFDGEKIYMSDGSSTIHILDRNTYQTIGSIEVYDNRGKVDLLNELEYIDGKIYANIYKVDGSYANKIVIIDPRTGAVESTINLIGLHPLPERAMNTDYILNGIAHDNTNKRLFVTGKYWPKLFEIELVKN